MALERNALRKDKFLSNLMLRRMVSDADNVANKIAPFVQTDRKSDLFLKFDDANTRLENSATDEKGGTNEVDFGFTTDSFRVSDYGFRKYIHPDLLNGEVEKVVADNIRQAVSQTLTDMLLIDKEYRCAKYFMNTTNLSGRYSALSSADAVDNENSDILEIFDTAFENIRLAGGKEANGVTMNKKVWRKMRRHPALLKKLGDDTTRRLNIAQFKEVLADDDMELSNVLIAKQTYNTQPEGKTSSFADVWGDGILFYYTDQSQKTVMENTFAKSFYKSSNAVEIFFYNHPDPDKEGQYCKAKTNYGFKITNKNLAWYYSTALKA